MEDENLATRVVELLRGRGIATAESCTAGRIAEVLACVDNADDFFVVDWLPTKKRSNATCCTSPPTRC